MELGKEIPVDEFNKWITALRSGKYKQGRCMLQSEAGYCCLGVACEILIPEEEKNKTELGLLYGMLPIAQRHAPGWLKEIEEDFGTITNTHESRIYLAHLNDVRGLSFDEIADILELVYVHRVFDQQELK